MVSQKLHVPQAGEQKARAGRFAVLKSDLFRRVLSVGFFQALAQAANAAAGILIVRALDKPDYGTYALFFSVLSMIAMLSGIGIHMGVSVIGGRVWEDRRALGTLVRTLEGLRMTLFKWMLVPMAAYTFWLFWKNGIPMAYAALSLGLILTVIWLQIHANLKFDVAKLLGRTDIINRFELVPALVRLAAVAGCLFFLRGMLWPVLLVTLVSYFVQYWMINRQVAGLYEPSDEADAGFRRETVALMKSDAPNILYFVFQGQIVIVLLSVFLGVTSISNVTALGRIMVIFTVLNATVQAVLTPVFAKEHDLGRLRSKFLRSSVAYLGLMVGLCAFTYFFPDALLWVLGGRYAGLRWELFAMMLGACFFQYVSFMYHFISSKGWIKWQWLYTPLTILNQIVLILALDLKTEMGIIWFGALGNFGFFAINCVSLWLGFTGRAAKPGKH